ncbi:EH domain-binding protein 1 isoform X1 [Drosophila novamexicana]|uniref:EH domain-binding protein 1 isoform X1 n=1 Tax=Drosophila novamexicana TaxID=47314 RepID=UPI0011E5A58B|nr:EH domain-binding protein 1 isoform X1 [Drosophila novamexicana]XP_030557665.1 EH domain-binding protein 1 isoform X1 [Drosophila novamexicana]XP_030557666.1 EH domain-binding protein 1 isoform X1 [Drosophila novamexicana]XP_030557667.1 EH domain-binding protein 1 isoform X1 [Drosophila novamexicana]
MGSVWKRLQRVNKRAAKFQFTASYHDLRLETTAKWRPSNLSVVWTRRSRRVASSPLPWEPDMMNPLVGNISWPVPDNHAISVTLFKDPRTHELEDKDWTFVVEDISLLGKKRVLANASINMRKYASVESTQQSFTLNLKPVSRKITAADLELTISCVFLREGKATDEDMQSVVSFMSVNNNCDVAPLDDLEDIPDLENSGDISDNLYDFTQQLEQMTTSLNGCTDVPTPLSVPSLSEDPTPLAESFNPLHFEQETDHKNVQPWSIVKADEPLNTPSAHNSQLVTRRTPIKDTDLIKENNQIAIESLKSNQNERFQEILTSTPIEAQKATVKVKSSSSKALNFDNHDCSAVDIVKSQNINSYDDEVLRVTVSTTTEETGATQSTEEQTKPIEDLAIVPIAKRPELQPLNLKKNYESTPTINKFSTVNNASLKPVEKIVLKDNTPGQDLLEWCKEVTKDYPNVKVTNLTTSWRNGMAFCAIIHHFMPRLIDMSKLSAHDVVGNCRIAFDAAETLGIPRVIEPRDMNLLTVPDKLAVMTYLHQLRAHFTGKQLQIEQIGPTSDESSYVIGNYKSDNLSQNLINFSHLKTQLLHQNSFDEENICQQQQLSPTSKKDVKNLILTSSKNILGKVLSPTKDKNVVNAIQIANQTTKSSLGRHTPPPPIDGNSDTCEEMQKLNKESTSPMSLDANATNEDRQQRLREQARRLILETRNKIAGPVNSGVDSPTTPTKLKRFNYTPERTISPIHNGSSNGESYIDVPSNKIALIREKPDHYVNHTSPSHKLSDGNITPLQSFNAVVERISPKHEKKNDRLTYIESELEALEREQEAIDQKASSLEAKLRAVMGGNPSNNKTGTNPFLRLIRNSIGGGDVIRIKLLDWDDESLFGSGASGAGSGTDDDDQDDDETYSDTSTTSGKKEKQHGEVQAFEMKPRPEHQTRSRPRAQSCFVTTNLNYSLIRPTYQHQLPENYCHRHQHGSNQVSHHVRHVGPYSHSPCNSASVASSRHSFCDKLQALSAEDVNAKVVAPTDQIAFCRKRRDEHKRAHQKHRRPRPRSFCETEETEEQLLSQWFTLVNKKNALLRRQMQLNILEQEKDLERKFTMLNQELRAAQSVEDWRKTEVQREKERLLLEELVTIVDKRDQLVQHLHNQEIAIEDDHEIARELEQVDISGNKEKCILQ